MQNAGNSRTASPNFVNEHQYKPEAPASVPRNGWETHSLALRASICEKRPIKLLAFSRNPGGQPAR